MKLMKLFVVSMGILILAACAGTNLKIEKTYTFHKSDRFSYKITDNAGVSDKGMSIFKNRLDSRLDLPEVSSNQANRIIEITFVHYRMRHGAARAFVGAMAGSDNITSKIIIKNSASGEILGRVQLVSKNPTATGSARGLIEQHADKIIDYIKGRE